MRESEEDQEPVHRAASIKKATNGECITLVNEVYEDQSLFKYRSDQVKKTKWADSWIPRKLRVFVLLAHTFRSFGFTYYEIRNNTFVEVPWTDSFLRVFFQIILVSTRLYWFKVFMNWIWRTMKDFSAFTVKHNTAKSTDIHSCRN